MPPRAGPVLVVDDDAATRDLVVAALQDEGYQAIPAAGVDEALALLGRVVPCLVLVDLRMPGLDGDALLESYRQRAGAGAPVVIMSAVPNARETAAQIGADGVLLKPFDLDDLYRIVAESCQPG